MDLQEFLAALRNIKSEFVWDISPTTRSIRGFHKDHTYSFCPITAVYMGRTGFYHPSAFYRQCAGYMGMKGTVARYVATASDGDYHRRRSMVRKKIMEALGLKEPGSDH